MDNMGDIKQYALQDCDIVKKIRHKGEFAHININEDELMHIFIPAYKIAHSAEVAEKAKMLAEKNGMTSEFCKACYTLGLIHDIGFNTTPSKERKSISGYNLMEKEHPLIGQVSAICNCGFVSYKECNRVYNEAKKHNEIVVAICVFITLADNIVNNNLKEITFQDKIRLIANCGESKTGAVKEIHYDEINAVYCRTIIDKLNLKIG